MGWATEYLEKYTNMLPIRQQFGLPAHAKTPGH